MADDQGNGWRSGRDPIQRWLRAGATVVCIGVFSVIALDDARDDLATLALALGAALVLLGYETIIRIPGIGRDK
jgi:hypothetical protein